MGGLDELQTFLNLSLIICFFAAIYTVIYTYVAAFYVICLDYLFYKAGIKCWKAIIPFYNLYLLTEMCGYSGWFFLLTFVPYGSIALDIMLAIRLPKCFGKGAGYTIGLIFLPIIFFPLLAFGDEQYRAPTIRY